jgi:putative tryptophan/tyrosine transport system substrate-binding protein
MSMYTGKEMRRSKTNIIVLLASIFILLITASCSESGKGRKLKSTYRVGIVQLMHEKELDTAREGVIEAIRGSNLAREAEIIIDWADAGGQRLAVRPILEKFQADNFDLLVTISSPCLEEAIRTDLRIPLVFGVAINPKVLGLGEGGESRQIDISGVYGEPPLPKLGDILMKILPQTSTVGVLWNPSEINSRYEMLALRTMCRQHKLEILEGRARTKERLIDKAYDLMTLNPDVIVLISDNTVARALPAIAPLIKESNIPAVSDVAEFARNIAVLAVGFDFHAWGVATGNMAVRVLSGTPARDIPFESFKDLKIAINMDIAHRLKLKVPKDVLAMANQVIR